MPFYDIIVMFYIKSIAKANDVTTNGRTMLQYPPAKAYTTKKAMTDNKKYIQ